MKLKFNTVKYLSVLVSLGIIFNVTIANVLAKKSENSLQIGSSQVNIGASSTKRSSTSSKRNQEIRYHNVSNSDAILTLGGEHTIFGTTDRNSIIIRGSGDINNPIEYQVTLKGVCIGPKNSTECHENDTRCDKFCAMFIHPGAIVNLTLVGDNTLTSTIGAGIEVSRGSTITINDDGKNSTLNVSGGLGGSGIGGGGRFNNKIIADSLNGEESSQCNVNDSINININSGTIIAKGGEYAAGVGGGYRDNQISIKIYGGKILANITNSNTKKNNGFQAAGIGSGVEGFVDDIYISGGTIESIGKMGGAGIGSGRDGKYNEITIDGGNITTTSEGYGAGIGAGHCGTAGTININGGNIIASCKEYGPGIGGGTNSEDSAIRISNGKIIAIGGKGGGAGIGGGNSENACTIIIKNGMIITKGQDGGADIGGGQNGTAESISINLIKVYIKKTKGGLKNDIDVGDGATTTDKTSKFYPSYHRHNS